MEILKNIAADDAYTPAKAKPHVPKFSPMSVIDSDYALPGDETSAGDAGQPGRNLMGAFDRVDGGAGDALMKKTTRPDSEELMSVALPAPLAAWGSCASLGAVSSCASLTRMMGETAVDEADEPPTIDEAGAASDSEASDCYDSGDESDAEAARHLLHKIA